MAENLAVVCLDCHSLVSGSRGLGKKYKPGEVRRYTRAGEKFVEGAEQFFQIGLWYSNRRIVNEVIKGYEEALDACYSDKKQFA